MVLLEFILIAPRDGSGSAWQLVVCVIVAVVWTRFNRVYKVTKGDKSVVDETKRKRQLRLVKTESMCELIRNKTMNGISSYWWSEVYGCIQGYI